MDSFPPDNYSSLYLCLRFVNRYRRLPTTLFAQIHTEQLPLHYSGAVTNTMFATRALRQAAQHAERVPSIKFIGKRSVPCMSSPHSLAEHSRCLPKAYLCLGPDADLLPSHCRPLSTSTPCLTNTRSASGLRNQPRAILPQLLPRVPPASPTTWTSAQDLGTEQRRRHRRRLCVCPSFHRGNQRTVL